MLLQAEGTEGAALHVGNRREERFAVELVLRPLLRIAAEDHVMENSEPFGIAGVILRESSETVDHA